MKPVALKMKCALALVIGGILAAGPVMAEKPSWAGKGGKDEQKGERRNDDKKSRRDRDGPSV